MRLIDADALIAQEEYFTKTFEGDFGEQVARHTIEILMDAPTVEVPVDLQPILSDTYLKGIRIGALQALQIASVEKMDAERKE